MIAAGLLITFLGFLISFWSLALASGNGARLVITLVGIAVSLAGLLGVLNRHYLTHAIWRK